MEHEVSLEKHAFEALNARQSYTEEKRQIHETMAIVNRVYVNAFFNKHEQINTENSLSLSRISY